MENKEIEQKIKELDEREYELYLKAEEVAGMRITVEKMEERSKKRFEAARRKEKTNKGLVGFMAVLTVLLFVGIALGVGIIIGRNLAFLSAVGF